MAALFASDSWRQADAWFSLLPVVVGFSLLSSAGYIFNDIRNVDEDRSHPRKRLRPLAKRELKIGEAYLGFWVVVVLGLMVLFSGSMLIEYGIIVVMSGLLYLSLTLAYSTFFRGWAYVDVFILAFGFVLRVMGGSYAINLNPTWWIIAITYFLAVMLGFGKRLGETKLVGAFAFENGETRRALRKYSPTLLRKLVTLSAFIILGTHLAYSLAVRCVHSFYIFTNIPVIAGIFAYLRLAWRTDEVEMPEKLFFKNWVLLLSVICWLAIVMVTR